jgi:hypothetical protein
MQALMPEKWSISILGETDYKFPREALY